MLSASYPNNCLNGPAIRPLKLNGDPAPMPGDLVLSSSDARVVFANFGTWTRIKCVATLAVGESVTATVKARSESLNIEDTAVVTFNRPAPNVAEKLDIDEPNYAPGVD